MLDSLRRGPQICDLEHAELRYSGVAVEPVEGDGAGADADAGADAGSDAEIDAGTDAGTDAETDAETGAGIDADTDTAEADSGADGLALAV